MTSTRVGMHTVPPEREWPKHVVGVLALGAFLIRWRADSWGWLRVADAAAQLNSSVSTPEIVLIAAVDRVCWR